MKHDTFAKWFKVIILCTAIIGVMCCVYLVPEMGRILKEHYPEFASWVLPWQILLYVCAIPCFTALVLAWLIGSNIEKDNSFCMANARYFKYFSFLALGDSIIFMASSIVFWLIGLNHPGLLLIDVFITFVGLAIFVCTSALSHFVAEAAELKESNDLTI